MNFKTNAFLFSKEEFKNSIKQKKTAINWHKANDVTLTFLCIRYPKKRVRHLTKERHLTVAKSSAGIYTIDKETFCSQIIVMQELLPEENLYLRSLIETGPDRHIQKQISDVCAKHKDNPLYKQYLNHFAKTATKNGGDTSMLLDPIFDEIDAIEKRTREEDKVYYQSYYQPQIDSLTEKNNLLETSYQQLTSQIQQLQNLLAQNNIPFNQGVNQ